MWEGSGRMQGGWGGIANDAGRNGEDAGRTGEDAGRIGEAAKGSGMMRGGSGRMQRGLGSTTYDFSNCFFPKFKRSAKRGFSRQMAYFFLVSTAPKKGGGSSYPGFVQKYRKP